MVLQWRYDVRSGGKGPIGKISPAKYAEWHSKVLDIGWFRHWPGNC
jgi:hypothetical protein